MVAGKPINPEQLEAELKAAGVIPADAHIGTAGDQVLTYDKTGAPVPLPKGAAAIIKQHTAKFTRPKLAADYTEEWKKADDARAREIVGMLLGITPAETIAE